MKKLFLILFLGIFMISFTSAFNWNDGQLQAYWDFNQGEGSELPDITGNLPNGTLFNMEDSDWVPAVIDNGLLFDGLIEWANTTFRESYSLTDNFTYNFWFNTTNTVQASQEYFGTLSGDNSAIGVSYQSGLKADYRVRSAGTDTTILSTTNINDGAYHMHTLVRNTASDQIELWIDGVNEANVTDGTDAPINFLDVAIALGARNTPTNPTTNSSGSFDEFGIWNRSLTAQDIIELYNGGAGLAPVFSGVDSLLISPDDAASVSGNVTFISNQSTIGSFILTNVTLFIWDSSDNLFFEFTNITLGTENQTIHLVTNLTAGDYTWNSLACANNGTATQCVFDSNNRTFTWTPFEVDNENFNAEVLETSRQDFEINITTIPTVLSVDSILNYNGTRFTATTNCDGANCRIETAIDVPLVFSGESQEKSFFWEITIFDGTNSITTNTSSNMQNVTRLHLEECDATFTEQTLNFTTFDEATLQPVTGFEFEGDFQFWLGTGTIKRANNFSDLNVDSFQLCLQPTNETFRVDATIEYDENSSSTNYTSRNYFFQNDTINNVSLDIGLGLLLSEDSTSFILKVQNRDILPQEDVLIYTQRFYPGEGIFRTVQVAKTDDNGASVGFFKTETVDYRFIINQSGQIILVTNKQKIVGEEVPFTLTFTIGEDEGAAWIDFEGLPELQSAITFNKTTNIVTFTYLDTSNNFTSARLIVEKVEASELTNTIICDQSSVQSSATITCNLTGNETGLYTARGAINREGDTFLVNQFSFAIEDFSTISGVLGLFLGWFVILICGFLFKFNEIAGIIMINLAVIFVNLIGLISFGYVFISALLALSIFILVVLER